MKMIWVVSAELYLLWGLGQNAKILKTRESKLTVSTFLETKYRPSRFRLGVYPKFMGQQIWE